MKLKFIEAINSDDTGDAFNWGKFLVMQLDENEWNYKSQLKLADPILQEIQETRPLLNLIGYSKSNIWVFDLQTKQGAAFRPHGIAHIDLDETKIWVCPMFEPFLEWLYRQNMDDIEKLPSVVKLPGVEGSYRGYQRDGIPWERDGSGI